MRLPPKPILLAAKRWLETLPSSGGVARAQALLTTHAEFSDLTPTQYSTALTWARDVGLLKNLQSTVPAANRVLSAIFEESPPPWVRDADVLVHSPDELPSDIASVGEVLGLSDNAVYEQLVSSWGKVDTEARERIGAAGEEALVRLLEGCSGGRVNHVSSSSDGLGYDIAFSTGHVDAHLEVKSTTRLGRFTAYLSRNEYRVMLRDDRWTLVAVRLTADLNIAGVGSVPNEWIAANVPRDTSPQGSWESCKLEIPTDVIRSTVPPLGSEITDQLPSWGAAYAMDLHL